MNKNKNAPATVKNELSKKFTNEIINPSIDLSVDYTEIFIDDLIDNEVLKEIPIVKSIVGTIRAGISINQFWFSKKLLTFIKEYNTGAIDNVKRLKFQEKLNNDKFRKKVVEQVMVFIDKHIEINKTKILAKLFQAFTNENLSYEEFISISMCLDNLHPDSYMFFTDLETIGYEIDNNYTGDRNEDAESLLLTSGLAIETSDWWHGFKLKNIGKKLYEFGIKPILV